MQVEMIRKAYVVTVNDLSSAQGQCESVQRELDSIKVRLDGHLPSIVHARGRAPDRRMVSPLQNNAPLVVALIDGDGTIFIEEYLARGREGGRDAAHALNERILEACGGDAHRSGLRVLVNVYLNRSGMGRTLLRSGVCTSQEFFAFCEGFTQVRETDPGVLFQSTDKTIMLAFLSRRLRICSALLMLVKARKPLMARFGVCAIC